MREEPCKTYGHLFPADQHIADAVGAVLSDWNIPECTELEGDIFRISFEGVFFPLDDVLDALRPLLCAESSGKIDLIDMEAWTLTRAAFSGVILTYVTFSLPGSNTSTTGSYWQMPMQPVCAIVTLETPRRATSSVKAASTGRAPAAIPQVAMPTTTRVLPLSSARMPILLFTLSLRA